MKKIHIVKVNKNYIAYLRQFDEKVLQEKQVGYSRKYVVVFKYKDLCFLAPISSPKDKHYEKHTGIDAIKIGKNLGVINLNNMIPVPTTQFKLVDFAKIADKQYIYLLKRQLSEMNKIKNNIEYKSIMIFNIATNPKNKVFTNLKHRCCNYKLLTYKAENYRFYKKQLKKQKKQDRMKLNKTKNKNRRK